MKVQALYEKAKKIAYQKKVSTNSILNPMLIEHGYEDESGIALKTFCLMIALDEDLDETPKKEFLGEPS
tara:strand:- start:312 stop:518 length:207 start_codon:yes stop_codon:yes gene_type:complete